MAHPPPTINDATTPDLLNKLAGIEPGSPLAGLRAQRAEVARYTQGSFETLLEPATPVGLSQIERELVALRVANLTASSLLVDYYQGRLRQLGIDATKLTDDSELTARARAILHHVTLLSNEPRAATPADIAALQAQGLGADEIVTLAQLVAFLHFQVRVLAGLRLLAEEGS